MNWLSDTGREEGARTGRDAYAPNTMKRTLRRSMWIALALCALAALFASASADSDPVSARMEISPATLSGPYNVKVSIQISNVGDADLPGAVTLYDPAGNRVTSFGSGGSMTLLLGQSYAWQGEWYVTQEQLNAGKISYKLSYPKYSDNGQLSTYSKSVTQKVTYNKTTSANIKVTRQITPEKPQVGQEVKIDYIIQNSGTAAVRNMSIADTGIGLKKGDLVADNIAPGEKVVKTWTFTIGESAVSSKPTYYYTPEGSDKESSKAATDAVMITPVKINISATLTANKTVVNKGEAVELVCKIVNAGNVSYKSIKITDETLGTVGSSISIGSKKNYTETKSVKVSQGTTYQFTITGSDSNGNPVSIVTNEVRVQLYEEAKPVSLEISIESDRDVVYKEPYTAIFVIKVKNTGDEVVKDISVTEAKKEVYKIASLDPGQEHVVAKEFTLSMGGTFQFAATAKNSLGKSQTFESNKTGIVFQSPKPTPSPTPTLTPTPSPTPTETATTDSTSGGVTPGGGSGGGIGNVLKYVLLGLLAVIVMGVGAMLILERNRAPYAEAAGNGGGRVGTPKAEVYDHLDRSARRDYTRAAKTVKTRAAKSAASAVGGLASLRRKRTEQDSHDEGIASRAPAQDTHEMYAPPSDPYAAFDGEAWTEQSQDDVFEPEIPQFLEPEDDDHLVPVVQEAHDVKEIRPEYTTEVPMPNTLSAPPPPARTKSFGRAAAVDTGDTREMEPITGSDGQYNLTRRSGTVRPKQEPIPAVETEDPASFARKQRTKRGREINMAQFYEEDDDPTAE